jgi:CBS-domain-containing membrane protein
MKGLPMSETNSTCCTEIDISETDVIAAMNKIQGYIDISPGDFREVFQVAYTHALQRIKNSLKAQDIMTQPVHCVGLDMDVIQAAIFLADKRFSGAPVIDAGGKIVGVLSEKDFLARMGLGQPASFMQIVAHCLHNRGCMATSLRNHSVSEIMTAPAITAGPETTMGAISALFVDKRINRLPIVDPEGQPVGIVTRTDLVQSYCLTR